MILCTTTLNHTLEVLRNLPKKKDIILSKQEASIDLLTTISQLLGVPAESIKPDVNLIELGLDSISMMRLTGQFRNAGLDINFAQLMETPTLESWQKIIASSEVSA
ncbi:acyl carrier protein [Vibrio sp. vnigr-6D03]|nr:acyl carrier protein [Vibrio sp. vnigr-6D03]